jgi:hypothetical protein
MKFWKKWDNEGCPQCGEPEDAEHILLCQGANANDTWDEALHSLQQWLDEQLWICNLTLAGISCERDSQQLLGQTNKRPITNSSIPGRVGGGA